MHSRNIAPSLDPLLAITRALADPTRLRILLALRRRELCACQITELFGLAPSTMSKHFGLLRQAGLVQSRKTGRWVFYRLPDGPPPPLTREALAWVRQALAHDPRIREDDRNLQRILTANPADLCRRQGRN